jgi:hypothetical protein
MRHVIPMSVARGVRGRKVERKLAVSVSWLRRASTTMVYIIFFYFG